ncbi:MAG: hypothetical protein M3Y55_03510 [Pseudomonadota bacterium]|nr:hypothetical protein [Pseudomonadota bacterium]
MDEAASDGQAAPNFAEADERIFALLAVVEDQQTAVRAGIQGLAQERAALATERVALVQQAEQMKRLTDKLVSAVGTAIPQMAQTAGEASRAALAEILKVSGEVAARAAAEGVKPELAKFTAAAGAAAAVQIQLGAAVKDFQRKWAWIVAFAIVGTVVAAALASYGAVFWQRQELAKLIAARDKLTVEVQALQEQADQADHAGQAKRNNGRKPTGK